MASADETYLKKQLETSIEQLKVGITVRKLHIKKQELNERTYHLDLLKYELVANTKQIGKLYKQYSLFDISKCSIDNFSSLKLKKLDRQKMSDIDKYGFSIAYENYNKTLYLIAPNKEYRDIFIRVLEHFIIFGKKRKTVLQDDKEVLKNYFQMADKSKDGTLSLNEIHEFLKKIHLNFSKDDLKNIFKSVDKNNDGKFDEYEFMEFMSSLSKRPGILSIFKGVTTEGKPETNIIPEYMTLLEFQKFLKDYQKEEKTADECQKIILKYEPNNCKYEKKFSYKGFSLFLNDTEQHLMDTNQTENIYQDMKQPLHNYFINSSHNTYLSGDQITSESRVSCYISVLMKGCRLLELDCHDGPNGPQVFHNYTLTTKLEFEDIIIGVKEYAFKASEYPVILTLENHCSVPQSNIIAQVLKKHLSAYLYYGEINGTTINLPALNTLKRKIFIRTKKASKNDESKKSNLDDLVNIFEQKKFQGIENVINNHKPYQGTSIAEEKANNLVEKEPMQSILMSNKIMIKTYPAGTRTDSSNYNPHPYWMCGFQMVALNFQKPDLAMSLNNALFNDNGQCGYVLKPEILRNPSLGFNPLNTKKMKNKQILFIKVISAQNLLMEPPGSNVPKDIIDPYVQIQIFGVPADCQDVHTKYIDNNGYSPLWNEDFEFTINCPELAFIRFIVKDKDPISADDLIGEYCIRYENMRKGYRHLRLKNKFNQGTLFIGLTTKSK